MRKLDRKAAEIMTTLLVIIAEEFDEELPDEILTHYGYVWDGVSEAVHYLMKNGYQIPFEVLHLIARFIRAAGPEDFRSET